MQPAQTRHDGSIYGVVVVLMALLTGPACGYSLAGRGSFLPDYIRRIGVPMFTNSTPYFQIEQMLTEKVRSELIGRGKYQVRPETTGVDAVLTGTITTITLVPATFNEASQAARYTVTLTASIEFKDVTNDKVLWSNPSLVFRDEYDVTIGTANDPNVFFGQRSNALERLSTDFARTVVSSILEAF